jgi:hypothetical protein
MTDLGDSLRRYFGKDINPYRNKQGEFEMWILEKMTEEQRRITYDLVAEIALLDLEFTLEEEEYGRRLMDNGWSVSKTVANIKYKNELFLEYDLNNIDPSKGKKEFGCKFFTSFGNDLEGRPIHYVTVNRLYPGKYNEKLFGQY